MIRPKCTLYRYVNKDEWPYETFPKYCSGSAFVLSRDMPARMYENALHIKFFWVG